MEQEKKLIKFVQQIKKNTMKTATTKKGRKVEIYNLGKNEYKVYWKDTQYVCYIYSIGELKQLIENH